MPGVVTADGEIIEMVYRRTARQTALLRWSNGALTEGDRFDVPGYGEVGAVSAGNNLLVHDVVLLPSSAEEYTDDGELLRAIRSFIHRYADVSEAFEEIAGYYVLLTWVYDAFSTVPYLRFRGDYGSGKSRCLQTIGSLCYRAMFASGASTVSPLFRTIDTWRGTLVLDEGDFRSTDMRQEITKILNNGFAAGFPVLRTDVSNTREFNPVAFAVFGPKILASRQQFDDRALESRCITENMRGMPPRRDIPITLPDGFAPEAERIRNRCLMYRFRRRCVPRNLNDAIERQLEPRIAQAFAPLLAIIDDPAARERVLRYARGLSSAERAERNAGVEAQLLDIICDMRRDPGPLGVKTIAIRFAERYGHEHDRPITPRWIGAQLRNRLAITTVRRNGTFIVAPRHHAMLEALFARYGVMHGDAGVP
jgi:hypothetical protein